jgi:hypothetical protein
MPESNKFDFREPINNNFSRQTNEPTSNDELFKKYIETEYQKLQNQDVSRRTSQDFNNRSQQDFNNRSQQDVDKRLGELQSGGGTANPALKAFAELSKLVSTKLNISNGPNAKKIAGQLQRDIKEKNSNIKTSEILSAAKSHLEKNMDKYKKLIK